MTTAGHSLTLEYIYVKFHFSQNLVLGVFQNFHFLYGLDIQDGWHRSPSTKARNHKLDWPQLCKNKWYKLRWASGLPITWVSFWMVTTYSNSGKNDDFQYCSELCPFKKWTLNIWFADNYNNFGICLKYTIVCVVMLSYTTKLSWS